MLADVICKSQCLYIEKCFWCVKVTNFCNTSCVYIKLNRVCPTVHKEFVDFLMIVEIFKH